MHELQSEVLGRFFEPMAEGWENLKEITALPLSFSMLESNKKCQ